MCIENAYIFSKFKQLRTQLISSNLDPITSELHESNNSTLTHFLKRFRILLSIIVLLLFYRSPIAQSISFMLFSIAVLFI